MSSDILDDRRLGILTPTFARGGCEEYVIALARWAQSKGWTPTVCLPEVDGVATVRRDLAAHGIESAPLTAWERFTFAEDLFRQSRRDTLRTIREHRFARLIIVLPTIEFGGALIDAAAQADVPTAVLYQLVPYRHTFEPLERQIYGWARRQKQAWLTVSQQNRDVLCESLGWNPDAVDVVPNAPLRQIDRADQPEREKRRRALRRELGLPEDAFIALTVARLHVQKAHDVLIRAAASLAHRHPGVHLVWAGTGEISDQLKTQVAESGLGERVHMLGHRTDVVETLLPAADVFVLPSLFEGMPFAALEAMAAGLPSVLSAIGPHREIATDGQEALLVPVGDSDALANAVERLMTNPEMAAAIGAAAHRRINGHAPGASFQQLFESIDRGLGSPALNPEIQTRNPIPESRMWPLVEGPRRRVAIFGAGSGGRKVHAELSSDSEVVAFLDSRAGDGGELLGLPIRKPDAVHELNVDAVVLASIHAGPMYHQLLALGFPGERIEIFPIWRLLPPEEA
jgi:glycosyltransferase involved in cell wall biosynthesis